MNFSRIKLSLLALPIIFYPFNANAQIQNKQQAQDFLDRYCIEIVNAIEEAYKRQKGSVESQDWKTFAEQGRWIGGLADVYSKLCK